MTRTAIEGNKETVRRMLERLSAGDVAGFTRSIPADGQADGSRDQRHASFRRCGEGVVRRALVSPQVSQAQRGHP
jgi:hypothetical protein